MSTKRKHEESNDNNNNDDNKKKHEETGEQKKRMVFICEENHDTILNFQNTSFVVRRLELENTFGHIKALLRTKSVSTNANGWDVYDSFIPKQGTNTEYETNVIRMSLSMAYTSQWDDRLNERQLYTINGIVDVLVMCIRLGCRMAMVQQLTVRILVALFRKPNPVPGHTQIQRTLCDALSTVVYILRALRRVDSAVLDDTSSPIQIMTMVAMLVHMDAMYQWYGAKFTQHGLLKWDSENLPHSSPLSPWDDIGSCKLSRTYMMIQSIRQPWDSFHWEREQSNFGMRQGVYISSQSYALHIMKEAIQMLQVQKLMTLPHIVQNKVRVEMARRVGLNVINPCKADRRYQKYWELRVSGLDDAKADKMSMEPNGSMVSVSSNVSTVESKTDRGSNATLSSNTTTQSIQMEKCIDDTKSSSDTTTQSIQMKCCASDTESVKNTQSLANLSPDSTSSTNTTGTNTSYSISATQQDNTNVVMIPISSTAIDSSGNDVSPKFTLSFFVQDNETEEEEKEAVAPHDTLGCAYHTSSPDSDRTSCGNLPQECLPEMSSIAVEILCAVRMNIICAKEGDTLGFSIVPFNTDDFMKIYENAQSTILPHGIKYKKRHIVDCEYSVMCNCGCNGVK